MAHDSSEHLQFDSRLANRKDGTDGKKQDKLLGCLPVLTYNAVLLVYSSYE
jgi:hypothetical protein